MIPDAEIAAEEAAVPAEPKRRRVRRKASSSATNESDFPATVEPNEVETEGEPAVLDVAPEPELALSRRWNPRPSRNPRPPSWPNPRRRRRPRPIWLELHFIRSSVV